MTSPFKEDHCGTHHLTQVHRRSHHASDLESDEFVPFAAVLLIGMLIGQLSIALILSALVIKPTELRDNRPDGFPLHAAYWAGLLPSSAVSMPNPYIRRFLP